MLYLTGIIITFFLAIILVSKRNKSEADHILAIWLICLGVHITLFYLVFTGKYIDFPYLLGLEIPVPLVHGPLLYLYSSTLTNQTNRKKYRILHFLPAVIVYLFLIRFYSLPVTGKIFVYQHNGLGFETLALWISVIVNCSGIAYVTLSLLRVYQHRKHIGDNFSNIEKINLSWLMYLIAGVSIIWIVVIFGTNEYIFAAVVLFVLFVGYFGIKQVGIFTSRYEDNDLVIDGLPKTATIILQTETAVANEKSKYSKSGMSDDTIDKIHQELNSLMQREKRYTDPELTLVQLSKELNIHANSLSQVINSVEQKNFYDYVNAQRIEEFKKIVSSPENQKFTLLSLAFECGFNSKTSFNRNFKKHIGISPSEYIKQQNIFLP
jgi:AraC-like DNA-binding protein